MRTKLTYNRKDGLKLTVDGKDIPTNYILDPIYISLTADEPLTIKMEVLVDEIEVEDAEYFVKQLEKAELE